MERQTGLEPRLRCGRRAEGFRQRQAVHPDADLSGVFSLDISAGQFNNKITGNKGSIKTTLKNVFGYQSDWPSIKLNGLKIKHLKIDPYKVPTERYLLESYEADPNGLSIGGVQAELAEVRLKYIERDSNDQELLGLELVVRMGTNLVQFNIYGKADPATGGFIFDHIKVKTENVECKCHAFVPFDRNDKEGIGQMLDRVYDRFYAPSANSGTAPNSGMSTVFDEKNRAELLENYKKATISSLGQNLVGGFPFLDDVLTIPFLDVQLEFTQLGTTYRAEKAIERSSENFTFPNINAHNAQSGVKRLPLELTPELRTRMGMTQVEMPANSRLLITAFEIGGSSQPTEQNTKVEFTLLVKIGSKYAQFVRKDVRVSPTSVDMKDFYMLLESDVTVSDAQFNGTEEQPGGITLKASTPEAGLPQAGMHSYAHLLCEGFQGFNVQGEYALPFKGGKLPEAKLKLRDLTKTSAETAEKQVIFPFTIQQVTELKSFIAPLHFMDAAGKPIQFVTEGMEGLIFKQGQAYEAYLDFDHDNNAEGTPDDAGAEFRGLYFKRINLAFEGLVGEGNAMLESPVSDFWFTKTNGMVGSFKKTDLLNYDKGVKLGGWRYCVDSLTVSFEAEEKTCDIAGRLKCPIFKDNGGKDLIAYTGKLNFRRSQQEYSPGGDFKVGEKLPAEPSATNSDPNDDLFPGDSDNEKGEEPEPEPRENTGTLAGMFFEAEWVPGLIVSLNQGSTITFDWASYPDGKKGYRPSVDLNGVANFFLSKKNAQFLQEGMDKVAEWGLEFSLPGLGFEGLKINKAVDAKTVTLGNMAGGINTISMGTWGLDMGLPKEGLIEFGDEQPTDATASQNQPTARQKLKQLYKITGKKGGMNGFPISLDAPEFVYLDVKKEWKMTLGISINLLKERLGSGDRKALAKGVMMNPTSALSLGKQVRTTGLCATTKLGFYFKPHPERGMAYSNMGLDAISLAGAIGPVEVSGAIQFLKAETQAEQKWGQGFKGMADLRFGKKPDGSFLFSAKAMCQFGMVKPADDGKFRYFFADFEAVYYTQKAPHFGFPLINIAGVDVFNLHGAGGGIYINMEKQPTLEYVTPEKGKKEPAANNGLFTSSLETAYNAIDDPLMAPGRSLSGIQYSPKYGSHGGYVKGIFSVADPKIMALDLAVGIEIGYNSADGFAFKKMFARGDAYMLGFGDIADRRSSPMKGYAEVELDFINKKISATAAFESNINYRPLFYLELDKTRARANMLLDFATNSYYFKLGTPLQPVTVKAGALGISFPSPRFYLQFGTGVDPMPTVAQIVPGWPSGGNVRERNYSPQKGYIMGFQFSQQFGLNLGIFDVRLGYGLGFDVALGTLDAVCGNPPRRVGMNGWRMKGQVYAWGGASVGMRYKIGPKRGRVSIFSAMLAAELNGEFPNPSRFAGSLAGRYRVLGGLIKGSFRLRFQLSSDADRACFASMTEVPNNPIADVKMVEESYPKKDETDVPIYGEPSLAFNYLPNYVFQFEDEDLAGNKFVRDFKIEMNPSEGFLLKNAMGVAVPAELVVEGQSATLKPKRMLAPESDYTISYRLRWYERINGVWTPMEGDGAEEMATVPFKTGKMPTNIHEKMLGYHAPGNLQRYWHQGYADPRIAFKAYAPLGMTWQSHYFPQKKEVPGVGTVAYDYFCRISRYANGVKDGEFDVPLSGYPGLKNFQVPVTTYQQVGSKFTIPKVEIVNEQGLDVAFSGLADTITTC
ncbi:MAG: hypothetical protein IPN76_30625 [Saprospiraceae bacterium]|nr:hypothetical protein [Saprospiraceae bacterium]